jgi:iron only hydrogenase large subunit-like protein
MTDTHKLEQLLSGDTPLVCMLAPSFVVDFYYPDIVWQLKRLGFDKVVELTFGAKMTNVNYHKIIQNDASKTWIASPCPTLVSLIKNRYPHLVQNLVPVTSPMASMALVCKKFYPKHKYVFVGPCLTKKIEAREVKYIELALTFKEIAEVLQKKGINKVKRRKLTFDKFYNDYAKIYPLGGGLSETMHYKKILKKEDVLVEDGIADVTKILDSFQDGWYKKYRFLDLLSCLGGCIGGPGIRSIQSLEEKKKKILSYREYARTKEKDLGRAGKVIQAEDINFSRKFE